MPSVALPPAVDSILAQVPPSLRVVAVELRNVALTTSILVLVVVVAGGVALLFYNRPIIPGSRKLDRQTMRLVLTHRYAGKDAAAKYRPFRGGRYVPTLQRSYLSPLSVVRCRDAWAELARSKGMTPSQLTDSILEDSEVDWGVDQRNLRSVPRGSKPKPKKGDLVRSWDMVFAWDDDCADLATIDSWRFCSDILSDAAFASIRAQAATDFGSNSQDNLTRIAFGARQAGQEELSAYWRTINCRPPPGSGIIPAEWYIKRWRALDGASSARAARLEAKLRIPHSELKDLENFSADMDKWWLLPGQTEWDDAEELAYEARLFEEAINVHRKYASVLFVGQLHMGLAAGLSSPRISSVLKATGYLVPRGESGAVAHLADGDAAARKATSDRTFHRMVETAQFNMDVVDSVEGMYPPAYKLHQMGRERASRLTAAETLALGGVGWQSMSRVRLLHTSVRNRLTGIRNQNKYDIEDGVPVNQEDLMATLMAFCVAGLWSADRMGVYMSAAEREAWVGHWRHVGFYMGTEPRFLARMLRDLPAAEKWYCCTAMHHYLCITDAKKQEPLPSNTDVSQLPLEGPALPLLHSISGRAPANISFQSNLALGRYLIGENLSSALLLPQTSLRGELKLHAMIGLTTLPLRFGAVYPNKRWARRLGELTRLAIKSSLLFQYGGKRASFQAKEKGVGSIDGFEVKEAEVPDRSQLKAEYRGLMREMVLVLGSAGVSVTGISALSLYNVSKAWGLIF